MNGNRIRLSVVDSTNLYTTKLLGQSGMNEFTMVTTDWQEQGRGQRGKSWQSDPGKNLLSSIIVFPKLKVQDQFLISASVALLVVELLQEFEIAAQIKWPNDIFVNGRKIAGILIENQLRGNSIESSVIGLGLNVNQDNFDEFHWQPTSMLLEKYNVFDLESIANRWQELVETKLKLWIQQPPTLVNVFNRKLFGRKQVVQFQFQDENIEAELLEVKPDGLICFRKEEQLYYFVNGEIKLLSTSFE